MKYLLIITFSILVFAQVVAQGTLIDKKGVAHFYSSAPLEDIEATNDEAVGAVDLQKGTIAVSMYIKGFEFENSLMQEHFNENYLESDKYPKASFKGKITDFSSLDFSQTGTFKGVAKGELDIHGVKKEHQSDVEFTVADGTITAKTKFNVALEDHDIKIPKLVIKNIAEVVEVDALFKFNK